MIEIQNLSFSYGKKEVLKNISLELEKGKMYAVLGPNGCGKTSFIKLLSRLSRPKSGKLIIDGLDYDKVERKTFAKSVALLPQGRNVPSMTVYDLAACGRFPHLDFTRKLSREDEEIVQSALRATGTDSFAGQSLKKLSGGERQRAYLAMLLAQASPYLLLDEPTTHLDISAKFEVMRLLHEIRSQEKCVVAVLHDLELAMTYADEILLMNEGEIVSKGVPRDIADSGELEAIFGVKYESVWTDGQKI